MLNENAQGPIGNESRLCRMDKYGVRPYCSHQPGKPPMEGYHLQGLPKETAQGRSRIAPLSGSGSRCLTGAAPAQSLRIRRRDDDLSNTVLVYPLQHVPH